MRQSRGFVNAERKTFDLAVTAVRDGLPEHHDDATEGPRDLESVPRSEDGRPGTRDGIRDDPSVGPVGSSKGPRAGDATRASGAIHGKGNVASRQQSFRHGKESLPAPSRARASHRGDTEPTHGPSQQLTIGGVADQGSDRPAPLVRKQWQEVSMPESQHPRTRRRRQRWVSKDADSEGEQPGSRNQPEGQASKREEHRSRP